MKRIISVITTVMLVLSAFPASAFAAEAAGAIDLTGGKDARGSGTSGSYSWDASDRTLSLKDFAYDSADTSAFILPAYSTVVIDGECSISATEGKAESGASPVIFDLKESAATTDGAGTAAAAGVNAAAGANADILTIKGTGQEEDYLSVYDGTVSYLDEYISEEDGSGKYQWSNIDLAWSDSGSGSVISAENCTIVSNGGTAGTDTSLHLTDAVFYAYHIDAADIALAGDSSLFVPYIYTSAEGGLTVADDGFVYADYAEIGGDITVSDNGYLVSSDADCSEDRIGDDVEFGGISCFGDIILTGDGIIYADGNAACINAVESDTSMLCAANFMPMKSLTLEDDSTAYAEGQIVSYFGPLDIRDRALIAAVGIDSYQDILIGSEASVVTLELKSDLNDTKNYSLQIEKGADVRLFNDCSDVSEWAGTSIVTSVYSGLFNGTADGKFSPHSNMTRAMLMTVLARFDGQDTSGGSPWYEKGMEWAKEAGISDGTNPEGDITREELATMLYRYEQTRGGGFTGTWYFLLDAGDASDISSYADEAMHWCVMEGIVSGYSDGTLRPQAKASRAEVAVMLYRYYRYTQLASE